MTRIRKIVLLAAAALLLAWMIGNVPRLIGEDEGFIRFVLGLLFSVLILLRWKPLGEGSSLPGWTFPAAGCVGALMAVLGIVFRVHQFEWLGLILVLYACLGWALPAKFSRDLVLALLLLYWVHPLPGQVFGRFQLIMQLLSLKISEWFLHTMDVSVWADRMVLYSAGGTFGVPESCSGMRAAVTVFLCTLGAGILLRLRWYEVLSFLFLGVLQVLVLNVLRISGMVVWAPRMPVGWAETFLHDTLGVFLLISIGLIQVEISFWKFWIDKRRRLRQGIRRGEYEPPDLGTVLPGFWRHLLRWGWRILGIVLVLGATGVALYKSREEHRVEMIRGTVNSLSQSHPEVAERVIARVLSYDPDDREMRNQLIRVLIERKKFEEALRELDRLKGNLGTLETVWKAWALMSLEREDEAMAAIDVLPERTKRVPGVAIIRAEFAARRDLPEEVGKNVVLAAAWPVLADRVRMLFPYLAGREQWEAIAACNSSVPFAKIEQALISIAANLHASDVAGAEDALRLALQQWPHDPRFLRYLGWVALNRRDRDWEGRLARNFAANIMDLSPDVLAEYLGTCFKLQRPDLAWMAYLRLQQIDERDPALYLAVAQFGAEWFVFRRRDLELPSTTDSDSVNLTTLCAATEGMVPFSRFWSYVPMRAELVHANDEYVKAEYLAKCLAELKRRNDGEELGFRMQIMYPFVLALSGEYESAHDILDRIMERWPDRRAEVLMRQATLYAQEARWEETYETLRAYAAVSREPTLSSALMNISAMMNLNMGIGAMDLLQRTRRLFPQSQQLDLAEVAIWDTFGFKDQALFLLRRADLQGQYREAPQLLYDVGYGDEAMKLSRVAGVQIVKTQAAARARLGYPKAEWAIAARFPPPLSAEDMAHEGEVEEEAGRRSLSPFIRELSAASARWYRAGGGEDAGRVEEWRAIGRDDSEKATALHRLAIIAARQGQTNTAVHAVTQAITHAPQSAILRRMLIGFTGGRCDVVEEAWRACPEDPEIWLALLVTRLQNGGDQEGAAAQIESAISGETVPPSALVRAGSFLLDRGIVGPAVLTANYCVEKRRATLPAYVLGLRCALATRNWSLALRMALSCADQALDPAPFFRIVVDIKTLQKEGDGDMISALKFLRSRFPEDPAWAERLGLLYFQQRDMKRALDAFEPLISRDIQHVRPQALLLASEAARQQGDADEAIKILNVARELHPNSISVLNNLVYYLAMNPNTVPRARALLGELLEKGVESSAIFDTAAMVYLNSGELELAKRYLDKAMAAVNAEDYSALESKLNSAKFLFRSDRLNEAKQIALEVSRDPRRGFVVEKDAIRLLGDIEQAERKKGDDEKRGGNGF